jgi:hypothetical protein
MESYAKFSPDKLVSDLENIKTDSKFEKAFEVAKLDAEGWKWHNEAQKSIFLSVNYDKYYQKFFEIKKQVDASLFSIPLKYSEVTADFISIAAKYHDFAEDERYNKYKIFFWEQVKTNLILRYQSYFLAKKKTNVISELSTSEKNTAVSLGTLEQQQWERHHYKDFGTFIKVTTNFFEILLNDPNRAKLASFHLAQASHFHDLGENYEHTNKNESDLNWKLAFKGLILHYYYALP